MRDQEPELHKHRKVSSQDFAAGWQMPRAIPQRLMSRKKLILNITPSRVMPSQIQELSLIQLWKSLEMA
tara:strand:- start:6581 stop:6787 length:207 start_codon:yes stop_codon:yes gene_type:complete